MTLQHENRCSLADDYYKKPEKVTEMETVLADQVEQFVIDDIAGSPFFGRDLCH